MARGNPRWGYTRIRGALRNLGQVIGRNTIKRILLENGIDPARLRKKSMAWAHLGRAVKEYTEHCHLERNHRGLNKELIEKAIDEPCLDDVVECQERLGGVLKYYYRRAA